MGKLKLILKPLICCLISALSGYHASSQVFDQNVANYILKIENPVSFLQRIEAIGVKEPGQKGLDSAYLWLKKISLQAGYTPITQKFLFGTDTLRNIEFIKKGSNDSCIIVGAHYDSKNGPGVNDNGTGNFALHQVAKLLKNIETKYTIRFIYFSGEEIDYLGSKYYVRTLNKDKVKIKFMLNLDQLGGTIDGDNSGVKCERDEVSFKKTESNLIALSMAKIYSLYTNLSPIISPAYLSDYLSFRDSGYIISGVYQSANFPFAHSESDLLKYVEFNSLNSTVKGVLAFVIYHSQAKIPAGIDTELDMSQNINVYYSDKRLKVVTNKDYSLKVYDGFGKLVFNKLGRSLDTDVSINYFKNGIYFVLLKTENGEVYKKFLVEP
ncbi:MAG: M28 family peptidase [Bacteroidia bacterium]